MTTERAGTVEPLPDAKKPRGTVQRFKDARGRIYYRARITYPDGERLWVGGRFDKKERAKEFADDKSREAERRGITVAKMAPSPSKTGGETCDKWHERYLKYCKERGIVTTRDKKYRWAKWLAPTIGHKTPAAVTREDVEAIRDELDAAIRDGRVAKWKTAANAWGELTVAFGEMCTSKRKDLRVLAVNPTRGVQPPERGGTTAKVYPYPSELHALVSCEDIPLEWREVHAIAAYTYLRPGELWVLEWADVDLKDEQIHIIKAWDFKNRRTKATKTNETRAIPIEPTLLPLLKRMHKRAGGNGLVVPLLSRTDPNKLPEMTREHFERAGCTRPRLYRQSAAERHIVFRSWRDAGITWSIVRGDDIVRVQRRAGHKLISTTQHYIVEAENRGATFGAAFPELPACLLESSKQSSKPSAVTLQAAIIAQQPGCEGRDLNPHASYGASTSS